MQPAFGFRELAHAADWELEAWAPDLPALLEQAARGMYAISGVKLQPEARQTRSIQLEARDAESLLVRFLSELLWLEQDQNLSFDDFTLQIDARLHLEATLTGGKIASLDKEIKAVTYHNLELRSENDGLHVNIVFDV